MTDEEKLAFIDLVERAHWAVMATLQPDLGSRDSMLEASDTLALTLEMIELCQRIRANLISLHDPDYLLWKRWKGTPKRSAS